MAADSKLKITPVETAADLIAIRELFLEYARSLNFSLCFQGFDQELASLPGDYAPPAGRLLLAEFYGRRAGCVAMHRLEEGICEMKRLYVQPEFRGMGLGRMLAEAIVREAKNTGYQKMRLDSLTSLKEAAALYRSLGFVEIPPYRYNPLPGAVFLELVL